MAEQPTLLLETVCRECEQPIPYSGVGRPRVLCDSCRPASSFPPVKEVPAAAERYVEVRAHRRRLTGDDTSPIPRHRITDPVTSSHAAKRAAGQGVEAEILGVFARYPELTDDELCAVLPDRYPPTTKSARSRLAKNGYLHDTGRTRPSARGVDQIVWTLRNT